MTKEKWLELFKDADETKVQVLSGLMDEAYDCKEEIIELKENIKSLKAKDARFSRIARRERLLVQKRASYTNMMARICKELLAIGATAENFDDLEEYE